MEPRHKSAPVEFTAEAEPGVFSALVSVFGNVDHVGDRVMPGAFKKTLDAWRKSGDPIPVVFNHDWGTPDAHIGIADPRAVMETDKGLVVQGKLDIEDNSVAKQVHKLLKRRSLKSFSFGYTVPDGGETLNKDDGANELTEIDLVEIGPTLKGANPEAQLQEVKSALGVEGNASNSNGEVETKVRDKASRNVGPAARAHLRNLIEFYMKKPHPFASCVRDNTKRFGEEGAKRVCATLKDIGMGTTHWREGGSSDEPFAKRFDPNQPRNPHTGEWIDGPPSVSDALRAAISGPPKMTGGRSWWPTAEDRLPAEHQGAIQAYRQAHPNTPGSAPGWPMVNEEGELCLVFPSASGGFQWKVIGKSAKGERDWEQELYDAADGNLEGLLEMWHEYANSEKSGEPEAKEDDEEVPVAEDSLQKAIQESDHFSTLVAEEVDRRLEELAKAAPEPEPKRDPIEDLLEQEVKSAADEPETVKPTAKADPLKDEIDRLRLEIAAG